MRRLKKLSTPHSVEIEVLNPFSVTDQHFAANSGPDDPQDLNTNHAIQQNETRKLSELLSKTQIILNELNPVQLNISEQPKLFWHSRYLTCLLNGMCSGLRGRTDDQEKFIFLEVLIKSIQFCRFWKISILVVEFKRFWLRKCVYSGANSDVRWANPSDETHRSARYQSEWCAAKRIVDIERCVGGRAVRFRRKNERTFLSTPTGDDRSSANEVRRSRNQSAWFLAFSSSFKVLVFNQPRSEKSKRGSDAPWTKIFKIRFQLFYLTEGKLQSISNAIDTQLVEESEFSAFLFAIVVQRHFRLLGKQTHELEVIKAKFVDGQPPAVEVIFNTDAAKDGKSLVDDESSHLSVHS